MFDLYLIFTPNTYTCVSLQTDNIIYGYVPECIILYIYSKEKLTADSPCGVCHLYDVTSIQPIVQDPPRAGHWHKSPDLLWNAG